MENVLAFDIGGTKIICAVVDPNGKTLHHERELIDKTNGAAGLIEQLNRLGETALKTYPAITKGAIASAGPLHPAQGLLLDPTNLKTNNKSWGTINLIEQLEKTLKIKLQLENDAAAAVSALKWSENEHSSNVIMLALGTGLGVGIIVDGKLVRAARGLHPEAGHIVLNPTDESAPCGCGNIGCAEAYLSGLNFCKRFSKAKKVDLMHGKDVIKLAENNDPQALKFFDEYSTYLSATITSFCVLYAPEVIYISGGFAAASPHFLEKTKDKLKISLIRRREPIDFYPQIKVSENHNDSVYLGAAYLALKEL